VGVAFGDIHVVREHIHTAADGKRYLLVHGDEFDQVTRYHRWIAVLGDRAYGALVRVNRLLSKARRALGISGYWSLSGYVKGKVKSAVGFIFDYEEAVMRHARERQVDGVICGHIHAAAVREVDGLVYVNCGDWVDSCTAIVEHADGRIELVNWHAGARVQERGTRPGRPLEAPRELPLEVLAAVEASEPAPRVASSAERMAA
jgi:UDP-2,3-diacylglucosamine pyrophosphatase LpxH